MRFSTPRSGIDLLIALSTSDLRARYGRGSWKSLKWLLDPFFATGVYLILVTFVIDRPGVAPGLSIACATVPFQLVIASVVNGLGSIQLRHSIVLNTRFDRTHDPARRRRSPRRSRSARRSCCSP